MVADSFVVHDPAIGETVGGGPAGEAHGRDGLKSFMKRVENGFPDFQIAVEDLLAGETMVMDEATLTATHKGEFKGVPPTNNRIELQLMAKFRVEDGQVQEHRVYIDQQEFLQQLGLTFPDVLAQLPTLAYRKIRTE
ncbi:ester cyclase [Halobellus rubicundus]|uniref:Ester cyclase n=1 Tax=Halobellus rubicundus TaxID=2996466 RepID=A0ABD5MAX4_9EURY